MPEYSLRPHHGLCISFFSGKGYSRDFTENMTAVIGRLEKENPQITLVTSTDIICRCCPHNKNGICDSSEKVLAYDNAVMNACGLESSQTISWSSFTDLIQRKIINTGQRRKICGGCQWDSLCGGTEYIK